MLKRVFAAAWAVTFNFEESVRLFADKFEKEAPSLWTFLSWRKKLVETSSFACDRPSLVVASDDNEKMKVI